MSSGFEEQISELMAEFHRQRDQLLKARDEFAKSSVTARSKDRLIEITLELDGRMKSIKFHGHEYAAMPPAQLSALLLETFNAAREKAMAKTSEAFGQYAAFGSDLRDSLIGGDEINDVFSGLDGLFGTSTKGPGTRPETREGD